MRVKLLASFGLIIAVTAATMAFIASQNAAGAVRAFMYRGGMTGPSGLATMLQNYYAEHNSWQGVDAQVLALHGRGQGGQGMGNGGGLGGSGMGGPGMSGPGMGMMNQRLRLADASGQIIADSQGTPAGRLTSSQTGQAIQLQVNGAAVGYLLAEGGMAYNQADERYLVNRLTRAGLTAAGIAAGLALLLALLLAYTVLRPVRALTQAAHRLGEGDLSQRVQAQGNDELAELGQTFNRMADSLQQAHESRKALTADIAHELRTPLAVQRAHLEALQDGVYPLTVEALTPILEQNQLLTRLVADLRTLALAEAGELKLERQPIDLAALAERVAGRFEAQAAPRAIRLTVTRPPEPLSLSLDPQRVEQILGNLLSNALRHTPDGGQIRLSVTRQGTRAQVQVQDSGPGIPPEALPYIFDRFYRADKARSRHDGGAGLGLSIARQLAEAHGGTLSAENAPEGGARFTLEL